MIQQLLLTNDYLPIKLILIFHKFRDKNFRICKTILAIKQAFNFEQINILNRVLNQSKQAFIFIDFFIWTSYWQIKVTLMIISTESHQYFEMRPLVIQQQNILVSLIRLQDVSFLCKYSQQDLMNQDKKKQQSIDNFNNKSNDPQEIVVKKQREKENDERIDEQLIEARKKVYNQGTKQQSTYLIDEQFLEKKRECLPMAQIINHKLTSLRLIHIEYKLRVRQEKEYQRHYSICAFELFKVINTNKLLKNIILKGVLVEKIQEFSQAIYSVKKNQKVEQREGLAWMNEFNPSKQLKLSIDARFQFSLQVEYPETLSQIRYLAFFGKLFRQVSNITVNTMIGELKQMYHWETVLLGFLWRCLKIFKQITIQIQKHCFSQYISHQSAPIVRSVLFGGLSSLTSITSLSFRYIKFGHSILVNDYLAMEQSLSTLFQNNKVTNLKLGCCELFPNLPQINGLQSFDFKVVCFRKSTNFMKRLMQQNPQITSINCFSVDQECKIDKQQLNQLQNLFISKCKSITLDYSSPRPCNIKHLYISQSTIGDAASLSALFPKLFSLTYLYLRVYDCRHQLLCTIPSPHLEDLSIVQNQSFVDEGLKAIDSKWPYLKYLTIRQCPLLNSGAWIGCKFKGLINHTVNLMLGQGKNTIFQLRKKGVKVNYFQY